MTSISHAQKSTKKITESKKLIEKDWVFLLREKVGELTDEESPGEDPLLGAADDGEGEPMRGDERVDKRDGGDPADRGEILGGEASHFQRRRRDL